MELETFAYVGYLLAGLIQASLFGGICLWIGSRKGYGGIKAALFFLSGFIFGIFAVIVAIFIPEDRVKSDEFMDNLKRSPLFREEREAEDKKREEEFLSVNGGWKCVFCGTNNYGYVGTCACGRTKQESAS